MKLRHILPLLAILAASPVPAETHAPVNLPTIWKAMILDRLAVEFPTGELLSVASTSDASEIVSVCGRMLTRTGPVPFHIMVFPGDPPTLMPIVSGVTENLADQVRSICLDAAIPLD